MILVTGATGNVGGALVRALTAAELPTRALVRTEDSARRLPSGAEPVDGDLNQPGTFVAALAGVSGLFMLSGYDGQDELLAAAKGAGVQRVVLLSSGSVTGKDTSNAVATYHLAAEAAVRQSGLDWTFLRPNSFMANALRWRDQLERGDVVRAQFPDVAVAMIDPRDIADVAVRAFTEDGHAGRSYRLTGPVALTPPEQVEILGRALGRPLRCHGMSRAETHDELHASMPAPYAAAFESFFADGTVDETSVTSTVETVTGHPARTFEQWTTDHTAAFRRPAE